MKNKKSKSQNIPKLRFPEFKKAGEWEEKKLGKFISERTELLSEKIPLYSLTIEDGITPKTERYERAFLVKDEEEAYKIVLPNDFAYNPMNLRFGAIGRHSGKEKVALSRYYNIFYCDNTVDSKFCEVYFKSYRMLKLYDDMAIGSLIEKRRVYFNDFLKFKVPLPSLPEQKRIADCLSSLDELIVGEVKKLDSLKVHKKGLIQGLFPSGEENNHETHEKHEKKPFVNFVPLVVKNLVPKLRFPEFKKAGEWEEKKLGDVAEFFKGKGISKEDINKNGKILCIRYGELYTYYDVIIDNIISRTNRPISELFISKKNDVIIPSSGETKEDIATASCILLDSVALGGDINVIRTKINGIFLSYYLSSAKKKDISRIAQGDTVVHLYISQLEKLRINFPSLPEQKRIAECLSSLDELIAAQGKKIELLRLHKKGLMQGLFPGGEKE